MILLHCVTIQWIDYPEKPLRLFFVNPPTRRQVVEILRRQWLGYSVEDQDQTWEFRLIAELMPNHPWTGVIETFYGTIVCQPIKVYENR